MILRAAPAGSWQGTTSWGLLGICGPVVVMERPVTDSGWTPCLDVGSLVHGHVAHANHAYRDHPDSDPVIFFFSVRLFKFFQFGIVHILLEGAWSRNFAVGQGICSKTLARQYRFKISQKIGNFQLTNLHRFFVYRYRKISNLSFFEDRILTFKEDFCFAHMVIDEFWSILNRKQKTWMPSKKSWYCYQKFWYCP